MSAFLPIEGLQLVSSGHGHQDLDGCRRTGISLRLPH
jgi:hypothetical protein